MCWTFDAGAACAALAIPLPPCGVPQARRGAHKRLHSTRRANYGLCDMGSGVSRRQIGGFARSRTVAAGVVRGLCVAYYPRGQAAWPSRF
jgi:hypothetical protein